MASVCLSCSNKGCQMYGEPFMKSCKEYVPMGIEERADKYYYKTYPVTLNIGEEERYKAITEAYIASAKENGIVWHKVADGDLPKIKQKVLVLLKDVEEPIFDFRRQDGLWNFALEDEAIAWKEIVLPKESE